MADDEFPPINRGNGVANDNLATLGDIMLATLHKVRELETKVDETKKEVVGIQTTVVEVKTTIESIDKANAPITKSSYRLLIATVVIGAIGLLLAFLAIKH